MSNGYVLPPRIAPGMPLKSVSDALKMRANEARNIRGGANNSIDIFNRYIAWTTGTERMLQSMLTPGELERLLLTRRYWLLQGMDPTRNLDVANLVRLELDDRAAAMEAAAAELETASGLWSGNKQVIVADTNFYIYSADLFTTLDLRGLFETAETDTLVLVIPLLVVDELDNAKRNNDSKSHARMAAREINILFDRTDASRQIGDTMAEAVVLLEPPGYIRQVKPDLEIIGQSLALRAVATNVVLGTFDIGMRLRATAAGLPVKLFDRPEQVPTWPAERRR